MESSSDNEENNAGGAGDADRFSGLAEISFFEGNNPNELSKIFDDKSFAGLHDLSCSFLKCDEPDLPMEENLADPLQIEQMISAVKKRNHREASLCKALKKVTDKIGDGDATLKAVEEQFQNLTEGLKNSKFLSTPPTSSPELKKNHVNVKVGTDNTLEELRSITTQTENQTLGTNKDEIIFRNVGTSMSPTLEQGQPKSNHDKKEMTIQSEPFLEIEDDKKEIDPYDSAQPVKYVSLNPEMLRLTFSPSIHEYESEPHVGDHDLAHLGTIEDLKLQISDSERKLYATKKFLDEMTLEREQERSDFLHTIAALKEKCQDMKIKKECADNFIEEQKEEITELEEKLTQTERFETQAINKLQISEDQIKEYAFKIERLTDIIKQLEEQIETQTLQAQALSLVDPRKDFGCYNEEDESSVHSENNDGLSYMEYVEELKAQVDNLVKKTEENVIELENLSWQNRPNSSCSTKSDDISVRVPVVRIADFDNSLDSTDARDLVMRISCRLRRVEHNFDNLLRLEEVLLKKLKDAEIRISNEHSKNGDLKTENVNLKHKIKYFENFLKETKQKDSTFSHRPMEKLRSTGFNVVRFREESSICHHFSQKGQLENEDNGFSDGEQGMEMLETSETTQDSSPIIQDTSSSTPKDKGAEGSLPDEQREGQDDVFPTSTVEVETSESSNQTSVGPVDNSPTEKQLEENAVLDASQKLSSPKTNEANVVIESFIEMPVEIQDEVMEKPQSTSRKSFHDDVHNTPPQNTTSRKSFQDDAHKTPPQNTSRKSFQEDGYNTVSRVASDEKTPAFLNDAPEPTNEENDSDILIYRIDTATDFEIQGDEVSYMGTEIIPSEDSNARFPSNDAQKSRLEGMDTLLQLEALKTQLDQMRQALEVEKQKSQELEKQIDQITPIGPNYPQDTGDRNNIDDQVLGLLDTLRQKQERECQLSRHLQCAVKTITELRDENQQIRNYIAELEQELQYYATQMDKVTNRQ